MKALKAFFKFVVIVGTLQTLLVSMAAAFPLLDMVLEVGPPWPNHAVVISLTVFLELLVYIAVYTFLLGQTDGHLRRVLAYTLATVWVLILAYVFLFSRFNESTPFGRVVIGYDVLPKIEKLYQDKRQPLPAPAILLKYDEYNPAHIWTPASLTKTRGLMLAVWLVLYLLLAVVFSTFVLLQQPLPITPPGPAGSVWGLVTVLGVVVTLIVAATAYVVS